MAAEPAAHAKARPSGEPAPGGRIDRLAAGPTRLFALRGGEVVTFDGAGQAIGRCAGFAAPAPRENHALLGLPDADEVLRAAGLPDDDSTAAAEDALDDEGLGARRRARPAPAAGVVPHALAAATGADAVWIATSSGIFWGDENGCATAGLGGRDLDLVASAGDVVVAASDDLLFRREAGAGEEVGGEADAAATFMVVAGLATRPRALAVGPDGEAIVADDDGVSVVGLDGTSTRILDRASDAVAICGDAAAIFSSDGVYTWRPGGSPTRAGDRPPARTLACGRRPEQRWVATGVGVWTSPDGTSWVEQTELLGRSVASAAVVGDRLWLAVEDGLLAIDATPDDPSTSPPTRFWPPPEAGLPTLPTRRLIAAASAIPWPWVTAMFDAERTPVRHAWRIMVTLTFPLGRVAGRRSDPTPLANALADRDRALAAEQADLRAAPDDDGRAARSAALHQEREALR